MRNRGIKTCLFLVLTIIFSVVNSHFALSETNDISLLCRNGSIVLMGEKNEPVPPNLQDVSEVDRFVKLKSLNLGGLKYVYKNKMYKMDWPEILKELAYIELFDPELSPYKNGRMVLKKKNGEKLKIEDGTLLRYMGYESGLSDVTVVEYDSYHKFWREKYLNIREVRIIRFEKEDTASAAGDAFDKLNFASTSEEIVTSLNKPKSSKDNSSQVNLNIEFDFDSYKIRTSSYPLLNELGRALTDTSLLNKQIIIKGHTDSDGPESYNEGLSLKRARSVRTYLISKFSISPQRLTTAGYGEKDPLVPNTTPSNKQINRRVEIRASL